MPAGALWALLPMIAGDHPHQGSGGHGLLLGALGVGAVAGALCPGSPREILTGHQLLLASGLLYGCGALAMALYRNAPSAYLPQPRVPLPPVHGD
ncbi:MFS transporter [Streptomyces sp. NPDC052107]|uniref:MFS transporter n=1 Tax=Streptomyces sp. NPDC052107 TaxID=3155632 RepID=UPI00342557BC